MVDLPEIPRRFVTTEAALPPVSASDIAGPYAHLGAAMEKLGDAIDETGEKWAKEAGQRAVTQDENGNLSVQMIPQIGRIGEAYNKAAQSAYLQQLEPNIRQQVLLNRMKFEGRPQDFADWGAQYIDELSTKQEGSALANAVKLMAGRHVQETWFGMQLARHRQDVANVKENYTRTLQTLDKELESLAEQGGTETDGYQARLADVHQLQRDLVGNPASGYSREKAWADLNDMQGRHGLSALVGKVGRVARGKEGAGDDGEEGGSIDRSRAGGIKRAYEMADAITSDPRFNYLGPDLRMQYYRSAVSEIKAVQSENAVAIKELNDEAKDLKKAISEGSVNPAMIADFRKRADETGAWKALMSVNQEVAFHAAFRGSFAKLPVEDRAALVAEAQGRGDARSYIEKTIGAESGGNVNAMSSTSSATGLGQFTYGTWLDVIKRHAPEVAAGKSDDQIAALRTNGDLSRRAVGWYAEDNAMALGGANIAPTHANLYIMHLLGPRDGLAVLTADPNKPLRGMIWDKSIEANASLFTKYSTAGAITDWARRKMGETAIIPSSLRNDPAFIVEGTKNLRDTIGVMMPKLQKRVDDTAAINPDELDGLGAAIHAVGTPEQKEQFLALSAKAILGQDFSNATPVQRETVTRALSERYAAGGAGVVTELNDYAKKLNDNVTAAYRDDPYPASVKFSQRPALPPVDPANPGGIRPALAQKVHEQEFIRVKEGMGPFSVLTKTEGAAWKAALVSGDIGAAANFLGAVGELPPDVYMATITSKPIVEGIAGMIASGDTNRMQVGFTALQRAFRVNPAMAKEQFGSAIEDKLSIWEGSKDYRSPESLRDELMRYDDPSTAEARELLRTKARAEVKDLSPSNIAWKMASGLVSYFPILPGKISQGIDRIAGGQFGGTAASAPDEKLEFSSLDGMRLKADYERLYTMQRATGSPKDKAEEIALKRLSQVWGPTWVSGSPVLMQHPPEQAVNPMTGERFFKPIAGSQGWIYEDIKKQIAAVVGPDVVVTTAENMATAAIKSIGARQQNWTLAGIESDKQTASEISRGIAPSYRIWIKKNDGTFERVMGPDGMSRFRPDDQEYIAKYESGLIDRQTRGALLDKRGENEPFIGSFGSRW